MEIRGKIENFSRLSVNFEEDGGVEFHIFSNLQVQNKQKLLK